jgi:hypothetical protein
MSLIGPPVSLNNGKRIRFKEGRLEGDQDFERKYPFMRIYGGFPPYPTVGNPTVIDGHCPGSELTE